jgi:hypothetical protein
MHASRSPLLALCLALSACSGLDPSQLERLRPGMDRQQVAAALAPAFVR